MTMGAWQTASPGAGMGRVVVDTSHAGSAFLYSAAGVSIMIDGGELRANWGPTSVDLPPGQQIGRASCRERV